MRLFVAICLSEEMKNVVTATLHEMKKSGVKGNYASSKNLHLTLAFIGETKEVPAVKDALQKVDFKSFRLAMSELGNFGDLLWVGVKGNQGLSAAVKAIRGALDEAGIEYDRQKFVPHITIIRKAAGNWKKVKPPKGEMIVKRISLMKSEEKNGKRVYTEVYGVDCR